MAALLAVSAILGTACERVVEEVRQEGSESMDRGEEEYGSPYPGAPPELSHFAFLVGKWRCDARLRSASGTWETLQASWMGRYALDGYAIIDEFRMTGPTGKLLVLGMNLRTYDVKKRAWNLKWLNALDGTWTDLGPEELGGVTIDGRSISYILEEPVGGHALTRATYLDIAPGHFTWRGERSSDGMAWEEFLVIDARRSDN